METFEIIAITKLLYTILYVLQVSYSESKWDQGV